MNGPTAGRPRGHGRWRVYAQRAIGPAILALVLYRLGTRETLAAIGEADPAPLIAAYLLFIPSLALRSLRWQSLISPQGVRLGFAEAVSVYGFSILVGTATPGRVGEFVKALHLREKGMSLGESLSSVVVDRLFDLVFLLAFGAMALWLVVFPGRMSSWHAAAIAILVALGPILLWLATRGRIYRTTSRWLAAASSERLARGYRDFAAGLRGLSARTLARALLLTGLAWGANYSAVYLLSLAIGFDIPFLPLVCIAAASSLVTMLPISVLGLGTRDVALMLMLDPHGVPATGAVAFSALILSMLLCNAAISAFSLLTPASRLRWRQAERYRLPPRGKAGQGVSHVTVSLIFSAIINSTCYVAGYEVTVGVRGPSLYAKGRVFGGPPVVCAAERPSRSTVRKRSGA